MHIFWRIWLVPEILAFFAGPIAITATTGNPELQMGIAYAMLIALAPVVCGGHLCQAKHPARH